MDELYLAVEQLRDILTGRETYNSDTECLDNLETVFQSVDVLTESMMSKD